MAKETEGDFSYIANQRYIIEIVDEETGRAYYSKRFGTLAKAVGIAAEYNLMVGLKATIMDTKEGEMI